MDSCTIKLFLVFFVLKDEPKTSQGRLFFCTRLLLLHSLRLANIRKVVVHYKIEKVLWLEVVE